MTNLPDGLYSWWVRDPRTLADAVALTMAGGVSTVDMGRLLTGDANDDNLVSVTDFAILRATMEAPPTRGLTSTTMVS